MASTRRSASSSKVGAKKEEPEETPKEALKAAGPEEKLTRKFEAQCNITAAEVYEDYDCMLNLTNIQDNRNNNKFCAIQVIKEDGSYLCWRTSGRVGMGSKKTSSFGDGSAVDAVKEFKKIFEEETVTKKEKYTLIELERKTMFKVDGTTKNVLQVNLDINEMPLGKLSEKQIGKGFKVLEEIEAALKLDQTPEEHEKLSSSFYSTIPYDCGKSRPPVINTQEVIDRKKRILMSFMVHEDYDCMLNKTNITDNRNINKFYAIQVIKEDGSYLCNFTSGRVGSVENYKEAVHYSSANDAVKAFEKKFKDKTANNWAERDNFVTKKEKYTLIELDWKVDEVDGITKTVHPVNPDMPLGKLSKKQIKKGFEELEKIEADLVQKQTLAELEEQSSRFYSTIPHDFGQSRPPLINTQEVIDQEKLMMKLLMVKSFMIKLEVYEDYDCTLNQTNIQHNNNKFYIIKVVKINSGYYCLWISGRVGENGIRRESARYSSADKAVKAFEKKFKDKTNNNWADRDNFVTQRGKYTLIELDRMTEVDEVDGTIRTVLPENLDIKKMPLGNLSEKQIKKGFEELKKIKAALKRNATLAELEVLSSSFYSTIPHNFGRSRPPVINTQKVIDQKTLMLTILMVISFMIKLEVYEDYDCTLNQTNIKHNNNKFYVIQVIKISSGYYCLWECGRVGENGVRRISASYSSADKAVKAFEKKFKRKTKNNWANRDNFVNHKYTLIELDRRTEVDVVDGTIRTVLPVNLDIKKMPLGNLSEKQIKKGIKVLEEIEKALELNATPEELEVLSSSFYSTIPHNVGQSRPPVINTQEVIDQKKNFLETLLQPE